MNIKAEQEAEKSALTRASGFFFTARFLPLPKSYMDRLFHTKSPNLVIYTRLGTRAQISSKNACTNPMQTTCGRCKLLLRLKLVKRSSVDECSPREQETRFNCNLKGPGTRLVKRIGFCCVTAESVCYKRETCFLCKSLDKLVIAKTTKLVNVMHHSRAFMNILREFKA